MLTRDELDLVAARLYNMMRPHLTNPTPKWLNMAEACKYAGGISQKMMVRLIDEGYVYAKKMADKNGKWIIDRETIDAYLNMGRLN